MKDGGEGRFFDGSTDHAATHPALYFNCLSILCLIFLPIPDILCNLFAKISKNQTNLFFLDISIFVNEGKKLAPEKRKKC